MPALGLGTAPQAFLTAYARQTKEFLGRPDSKRLVPGISIGYPDMSSKANSFRPNRVDLAGIVGPLQVHNPDSRAFHRDASGGILQKKDSKLYY